MDGNIQVMNSERMKPRVLLIFSFVH